MDNLARLNKTRSGINRAGNGQWELLFCSEVLVMRVCKPLELAQLAHISLNKGTIHLCLLLVCMLGYGYSVQTRSRYFPDCSSVVLAPVVGCCEVRCCG